MKDTLLQLQRTQVEVRAHGLIYRGLLVGADEDFVYLKGHTTWITLPMASVTAVKPADAPAKEWQKPPLEGEEGSGPGDREGKRRYGPDDLQRSVSGTSPDWPEPAAADENGSKKD